MQNAASVALMYDVFAKYYDRAEGDSPAGFAAWVIDKARQYGDEPRSLLELGCGTGGVLAELPKAWNKVGVDRSSAMLTVARSKDLGARLIEDDITRLALDQRFDVVACVFDTINHIVDPTKWAATFAVARSHLQPGGIFLWDMNTVGRLRTLAENTPVTFDVDDATLTMDVRPTQDAQYDWEINAEVAGEQPQREVIVEVAFPLDTVRAMVEDAGFDVLEVREIGGQDASDESVRAYFVCRARDEAGARP
ncbi:methyltransferase domain-containing protein [Epidermidibacterium keratini]|uniref:Methyltransferase domain-containing protein n=1 Tax=Epidermidibacterium keratini TaxID=1891644 RepID=A0A7L4YSI8_9ACTN|nr:class I SAM-dependent methyltransferase [Epidermidibacterium keratini]QHC02018.1 methyltransferase domain-containing protein [Epidermidibacterium keratini]